MPASSRSFVLTDAYRERLLRLRTRAETAAVEGWKRVDLAEFDRTFTSWLGATVATVARAQVEGVRLSAAYTAAFLTSELGERVRTPQFDQRPYVGLSRDGRPLAEALDTARIGVLAALKGGAPNAQALDAGRGRAVRMVELDTMHAARTALLDGIEADDRFDGWQRAVRGTCGACVGAARGPEGGLRFQVHPGCGCVSEPVVKDAPNSFPRPTGEQIFAAKSLQEQDEMLSPEAADRVRAGDITLADLVAVSPLETADDFITQRPVAAL